MTTSELNRDCNREAKDKVRCELLAPLSERLPLFLTVNAMQPNALPRTIVQHGDRVAVGDANHAAREVGGEGLTCKQRKAKEQRQGSNRLRTAHGISGMARTAPILLEAGRKGDSEDGASAVGRGENTRAPHPHA